MKVHKVIVEGYKNIDSVALALSPVTAIIGLNNFGKTNLLKGIEFGSRFIQADISTRIGYMSNETLIPINKKNEWRNFLFSFTAQDGNDEFEYTYSFQWTRDTQQGKIIKEDLKVKNQISGRYIKFLSRDEHETLYKATEDGRCQRPITTLTDTQLAVEYLISRHSDIFYIDILKKIRAFKVEYNRLEDSRIDPSAEANHIPDEAALYSLDRTNILAVLRNLKVHHPEKYDIWENTVKSLIPHIEKIYFDVEKKNIPLGGVHIPYSSSVEKYSMKVKEKNLTHRVDLFRLSTGIRRILLLILSIVLQPMNEFSIIEFEELESSINPLMLHRLLTTICAMCENCNIIVTSHSPTLINSMNLSSVYIGIANDSDIAQFCRIRKSREELLIENADEMGIGTGDFIFSMLLSDDPALLNEWTEKHGIL